MRPSIFISFLFATCIFVHFTPNSSAQFTYDHDLDDRVIAAGSFIEIDLGTLTTADEIDVAVDSNEEVDVILMTDAERDSCSEFTCFNMNGSEIATTYAYYTWRVEANDHYWMVIDNSERIEGGAESEVEVTLSYGYIDIDEPTPGRFKTRLFVQQGEMFHYDLGVVASGKQLDLFVDCEDWWNDDIDAFVVHNSNIESFLGGKDVWDRNASYLDISSEDWNFELLTSGHWHIFLENGPRGTANEDINGITVDINLGTSELSQTEITDTTRMIEEGDVWRVDLGQVSAGDVLSFSLSMDGLFDDLDVLVMSAEQATQYQDEKDAVVLGHSSLIDSSFFNSWDYRFPVSGEYALLLDNTDSPVGGASGASPIHLEIRVSEVTFLGSWLGWYQSRHYASDGGYVSFDFGQLNEGEDVYYSVSGHSHGEGFFNSFDILFMTDQNYQSYISGSTFTILQNESKLDDGSYSYNNFSISTAGHYWLVIDVADGPTGGADSNGAWTFDFTLKSETGSITSPQVQDNNYLMTATYQPPADPLSSDPGTESGVSNSGDESSTDFDYDGIPDQDDLDDDDDGISDAVDSNPKTPDDMKYSINIEVSSTEVIIEMEYLVRTATILQYATLADAFSDNSGYIDTESEKNALEESMCGSPAPLSSLFEEEDRFSFDAWISNHSVNENSVTIKENSCTWTDKRTIPTTSMLDTATLDLRYVLDVNGVSQPFTLDLDNISWTHPLYLPFNDPFSLQCVNSVTGTSCTSQEHWYPLSGPLSLVIDGSGSPSQNLADIGVAQSNDATSGSAAGGGAALFVVAILILFLIGRKKKNSVDEPQYGSQVMSVEPLPQAFGIQPQQAWGAPAQQPQQAWGAPPQPSFSQAAPLKEMNGEVRTDGNEWLEYGGSHWYRTPYLGHEWTRWG